MNYKKVWATHPDYPNYDGLARGRKTHLAKTNEQGTKTLCNMLVDDVFEDYQTSTGTCKTCIKLSKDSV